MSLIIPDKRFYRNEMLNFNEIILKKIKNNNKKFLKIKSGFHMGDKLL